MKQAIFDKFMEKFGPARDRREELANQPEYVEEILKQGVEQARKIASAARSTGSRCSRNQKLRMTSDELRIETYAICSFEARRINRTANAVNS